MPKLWTLEKADKEFSLYIRKRDGRCQYFGCPIKTGLECSHYHGRSNKGTRYDEENCVAFCRRHHNELEEAKQTKEWRGYDGAYTTFMRERLGRAAFAALKARATGTYPQTRAIMGCMTLLGKV